MNGLSVSILKNAEIGDCTNYGFSSRKTSTYVFSDKVGFEGNFKSDRMEEDYLVITDGPMGTIRAVPKSLLHSKKWVMFGGNFIYTSDSRFSKLNNGNPIKIFDRVEEY